jgi:hypothetical protein
MRRKPSPTQSVSMPLYLGVKRPRREADHPPLPNAAVMNAWCSLHSLVRRMDYSLIKHKGTFSFSLQSSNPKLLYVCYRTLYNTKITPNVLRDIVCCTILRPATMHHQKRAGHIVTQSEKLQDCFQHTTGNRIATSNLNQQTRLVLQGRPLTVRRTLK